MTDLPNVKIKTLTNFPSNALGGTGIDIVKANGNFIIDLNYSEIAQVTAVPTAAIATTYFLGWESLSNQFGLVPVPAAGLVTKVPTTITATPAAMSATDSSIIVNFAGTTTLTLLSASSNPGRWVYIKTLTANAVNSASSNVGALATGTAAAAILTATAGKWAILQSDGTNWQIMAAN